MVPSRYMSRQGPRWGVGALVAALHVIAIVLLVRAFAPDLARDLVRPATAAINVTVAVAPPPQAEPAPEPVAPTREGVAAPAARRARSRQVPAPQPVLALAEPNAPTIAGAGPDNSAGAGASGEGSGAGGAGQGLGAGGSGSGSGAGGGTKAVKIAGDIVSARDYPKRTRPLRLGSSVTIALTVTAEGRVSACRILRPSSDPDADRITCKLAAERFRFRPARDAGGQPISSVYGWQQRWFTPERD